VLVWLVAYAVAGLVAVPLPRDGGLAPWYPPLVVAVGIMVSGGLRWWPLVLSVELFGGWLLAGSDVAAIIVFALPTVIEAAIAAVVLRRLVLKFERGEDALLLVATSLAVALAGATVAAALAIATNLAGLDAAHLWFRWWISDVTTLTTLLPLVLLVVNRASGTLAVPRRSIAPTEIPVIFAVSIGTVIASAGGLALQAAPSGVFSALWVIPIAWMAVRYERLMAALVAAVMAATAFLAFTLPGMPTEPNNLLSLQASLVATGLIGTLVSASLAGRRQAIAGLEREEDRLRRSEALLADAASIGGIGSWEVDPGSGDATWSDELYRITGIAAGTPVRADSLPSLLEPGDAERLRADVAGAGQETALSLRLEALDGGTRAVVIAWRRQTDADGRPRIVGVVRDVTEEQALQEQLLQAQRVESIGMLAGGVAHDFNNLLTAIAGFTEFARLSVEAGESPDTDLAQVQAAVERARSLTGQLLAYGRRAIVHPRPVDLGAAVEAMSPMLGRLLGEHIEVRTERGERAVAVLDPGQLDQVLVNLAVNARDAMPSGGHLRIATGRTGTASGTAWLEVQDDGVGMDPDVVERIFLPFFTTKERGRGTGLGLSTVYGIVTQAGGTIRVTSQPDAGSTFRVEFPAAEPAAAEAIAAAPPDVTAWAASVLYVEDEELVRRVGERALARAGFAVSAAQTAAEARQLADRQRPDILVTDVVLPGGVDGITLAEGLRDRWPSLPVLLVSGYSEREPPDWAPLLAKPFEPNQLAGAVAALLRATPPADLGVTADRA
jgi:signal transduction histidine kinase